MIKIVDYGMGNLRSVQKAFEKLGVEAEICASPSQLGDAPKMVLPGVGAFRDAIHELKRTGLASPVVDHIQSGKPFLGICLGLQLLFDVSYEDGEFEGLGVIPGKVVRFRDQPDLKIPH
ncbi:MAG: imidazole glycerol phosphate synthase subunit HisH, partial [Planctomycetaceae bacterium]